MQGLPAAFCQSNERESSEGCAFLYIICNRSYGEFWGGCCASEWSQDYPNQWQKRIRSDGFGKPCDLIELNALSHLESMIMIKVGLFARRQHKSCIASSGENELHKRTREEVTKWLSLRAKVTKLVIWTALLSRGSSLSNRQIQASDRLHAASRRTK